MSRRKPLAALAAVTVALAPAVPVATASAATPAHPAHTAYLGVGGLAPGSPACLFLVRQIQAATLFHNTPAASFWSNVFIYSGCGGAAI